MEVRVAGRGGDRLLISVHRLVIHPRLVVTVRLAAQHRDQILVLRHGRRLLVGCGRLLILFLVVEGIPLVKELLQTGELLLLFGLLLELLLRLRAGLLFLLGGGHFLGHIQAGVSRVAHADVLAAEVEELPPVGVQERNLVVADGQPDVNELALLVGIDVIIPLDLLAFDLDSTLHAGASVL